MHPFLHSSDTKKWPCFGMVSWFFFVRSTHTHCYMMPFLLHHLESVLPTNFGKCLESLERAMEMGYNTYIPTIHSEMFITFLAIKWVKLVTLSHRAAAFSATLFRILFICFHIPLVGGLPHLQTMDSLRHLIENVIRAIPMRKNIIAWGRRERPPNPQLWLRPLLEVIIIKMTG